MTGGDESHGSREEGGVINLTATGVRNKLPLGSRASVEANYRTVSTVGAPCPRPRGDLFGGGDDAPKPWEINGESVSLKFWRIRGGEGAGGGLCRWAGAVVGGPRFRHDRALRCFILFFDEGTAGG